MSVRRIQGAVLVAGAVALWALIEPGPLAFHWTPLLLGLSFLAAAAVGGPRGSYWASALVLTAWGAGVVLVREGVIDLREAPAFLVAVGVGALAAEGLRRAGWSVAALGVAGTILGAGLVFSLEPDIEPLGDALTYALALGAVGLVRLADPRGPRRPAA